MWKMIIVSKSKRFFKAKAAGTALLVCCLILISIPVFSETSIAEIQSPQYVRVTGEVGEKVPAYTAPDFSSEIVGCYYSGTYLQFIEEVEQFCHVQMGSSEYPGTVSYIQKENIEDAAKRFIDLTGIEAIGFLEMKERTKESVSLRKFPDITADTLEPIDKGFTLLPENGTTYELISDLGEWCQARIATDDTIGFLPSTNFDLYRFEDMIISEVIEIKSAGVFAVGTDIPAGLYTLLPEEGETADLRVEGSEPTHDQHYIISGPSHYTIYLPSGSTVVKTDGTLLRSTMDQFIIPYDITGHTTFGGNGRFLVGIELDPCVMSYKVEPLDMLKPALVKETSFSGLNPLQGHSGVAKMREADQTEDPLLGTFFEVSNCVLTPTYDNVFHYGFPIN